MAVFCILLAISIRLFSGAQNVWLRSEQKTDTFASARTAMEFFASRLQTIEYYDDEPFGIVDDDGTDGYEQDSIWFVSCMALGDGGHKRHLVRFHLVDPTDKDNKYAGNLQLQKYTGQEKGFYSQLFPSYDNRNSRSRSRYKIKSRSEAITHIKKVWKELDDGNDEPTVDVKTYAVSVDLIENVVGLKLIRFVADGSDLVEKNGNSEVAPYLVEIELRMLDSRESFKKWQDAGNKTEKDNIFIEHGYTFRRAVLLGKKGE